MPEPRGKRLEKHTFYTCVWGPWPQWARDEKRYPSGQNRAETDLKKHTFYTRVWGPGPQWARDEKRHPSGRNRAENDLKNIRFTLVSGDRGCSGREMKSATHLAGTTRKIDPTYVLHSCFGSGVAMGAK